MSTQIDMEALEIHTVRTHNVTVVELLWTHPEYGDVLASGASQRHPNDRDDQKVGYGLALSRAFASLSRKIERRANGFSHDNDNAAKARKARKNHPATQRTLTVATTETIVPVTVASAAVATDEKSRKKAKRDLKVLRGKN